MPEFRQSTMTEARLRPYPFAALVRRMFRELDERQSVFDLPARRFYTGAAGRDLSVAVHGRPASTPFGPAAGPHTQLAQNIVLSWLGGGRVIELKTVQVNDHLVIPRPCIDVQTVGYNIEWSQELTLEESLEEYVKASMLVTMLAASGKTAVDPAATKTVYDMSVGYDLAGVTSAPVRAFMAGLLDAGVIVDRLRGEIPEEYRLCRDLDYATRISDTLTLSTFHGCPAHEIAAIVEFLMREVGLDVTVKLNPMLLGETETNHILHDVLGYGEIRVPPRAFANDLAWDDMVDIVERLGASARDAGRGFGVKFTNTLVVENHRSFFPAGQAEMYLSGAPLHVLAMHLVRRFRGAFGERFPVSFSGGIDRRNFADAVALGLVPVTACTDLLRPGGYARARGYLAELCERMDGVGATDIPSFVARAYGGAGTPSRNAETYVERAAADPRYSQAANTRTPRKIGRRLRLFDCISCDKCVPVCPNDANFTFVLPRAPLPVVKVRREAGAWHWTREGTVTIDEPHQIGNFADFCNDCGNCDVFCPEDGGPYVLKPRLFGSAEAWRAAAPLDGFHVSAGAGREHVLGRFAGQDYRLDVEGDRAAYCGNGFALTFAVADPEHTLDGDAAGAVDLTYFQIMNALRTALIGGPVNYVNARLAR
jgi:putative selenate reductase